MGGAGALRISFGTSEREKCTQSFCVFPEAVCLEQNRAFSEFLAACHLASSRAVPISRSVVPEPAREVRRVIGSLVSVMMMTYMLVRVKRKTPMQIAIAEAKAQFAELIRRAEAGEAIELTRYGRPVARIVAASRPVGRSLIGALEGKFALPDDMFEGDEEIADMFEYSAGR